MTLRTLGLAILLLWTSAGLGRAEYQEVPFLSDEVARGTLPPIGQRVPARPSVVRFEKADQQPGRYGGELRMLMSQPRDTRMMVVYGYARLVGYTPSWKLVPDILEKIEVEDGRIFTMTLRQGHRWSDGQPFTAEDFRFYWQDIANNPDISPSGPDHVLRVDGEAATFSVINETTVRYAWSKPNPFFLPALAQANPQYIFAPAHYLKRFHAKYTDPQKIDRLAKEKGQRNWLGLFANVSRQYRNDNPDLPTLEPWVLRTQPPSSYFVFERNPYYHRVDESGQQLPYIDKVLFNLVSPGLIPAKTAAGDSDLQARGLGFNNITVLKQGEKRNPFKVLLWKSAHGSHLALYPNLNAVDPQFSPLLRETAFRRALSLAINREEINQVIYAGLARAGNDTVLPQSPLFKEAFEDRWAEFDLRQANALLDGLGLAKRDGAGIRLLTGGRRLEMVVETAGEDPTETAILQLIESTWRKAGISLLIRPEQREILRNRVFAGEALLSVWYGLENGLATAEQSPRELAPTSQQQFCWPKWGLHYETGGQSGEAPNLPVAQELVRLNQAWATTRDMATQHQIWQTMLTLRSEEAFSIGTVREVPQPVVANIRLKNVPRAGIYNWDPGAHFGVYRPDTFWYAPEAKRG